MRVRLHRYAIPIEFLGDGVTVFILVPFLVHACMFRAQHLTSLFLLQSKTPVIAKECISHFMLQGYLAPRPQPLNLLELAIPCQRI